MSCNTISIDELARTTPVTPPIVNRKTNPSAHKQAALYVIRVPYNVESHLKILIPVGTAMIVVADVKYAWVSMSIPTVNIWHSYYIKHAKQTQILVLTRLRVISLKSVARTHYTTASGGGPISFTHNYSMDT